MQYLLSLALLPAILLMLYIHKMDKIEKEPFGLLAKLVIFGALTTISAVILENIGDAILGAILPESSIPYIFLENFFVVAAAEEAGKYFVLKKTTWKNPAFNYTFDAVVYAVAASLGFAALENVLYVFDGGLSVAILRAFTSIPGHTIFGVFMGCYYGMAKKAELAFNQDAMKKYLRHALIVPLLAHGFYDYCLTVGSTLMLLVFAVYDIALAVYAFRLVKKLSATDSPVVTQFNPPTQM